MSKNSNLNEKFTTLRWACRRGMLELDLLLGHFLEANFDQLSQAEQAQLTELLTYTDTELFAWFFGNENTFLADARLLPLAQKIKAYARASCPAKDL